MDKNVSWELNFIKHSDDWRNYIPLGNGRMGVLVSGCIGDDRIVINSEDYYVGARRTELPNLGENLKQVREYMDLGEISKAERVYPDGLDACDLGSCGKFMPLADLVVRIKPTRPYSNYSKKLNMIDGECVISWAEDGYYYQKRYIVSRKQDALWISFKADKDVELEVGLWQRNRVDDLDIFGDKLNTKVNIHCKDYDNGLIYKVSVDDGKAKFLAVQTSAKVKVENGKGTQNALGVNQIPFPYKHLKVIGNDLLIKIDLRNNESDAIDALNEGLSGYQDDLYFTKTENNRLVGGVDFSFGKDDNRTIDELLLEVERGDISLSLIEKMAKFGRYVFVASCIGGKYPSNLQGIWNGSYDPPWWAGYFMNENLPMCLWQACQGGLSEGVLSFFNLAESLIEDFRYNAKKLFNCNGFFVPTYFTPENGRMTDKQPHVVYWVGGTAWLMAIYYDYYRFTGDEEFLIKRALPLMVEAAGFYEDYLIDKEGVLQCYPSISPENCANGSFEGAGSLFVSKNATMDIALIKELFLNLESLGYDKYGRFANKLPKYQISKDGSFKEWLSEEFLDNHLHRHLSHVYPFFPGVEISINEQLSKSIETSIKKRQTIGLESQTGWSFAHLANVYARLGNGDECYEMIKNIIKYCTLSNLFTTHNDWRDKGATLKLLWSRKAPFQIDANMGLTSAVFESFVVSTEDEIYVMPAIITEIKTGYMHGIKTRAKTSIDIDFDNSNISVEIVAILDTEFWLVFPNGERERIRLKKGEKYHKDTQR